MPDLVVCPGCNGKKGGFGFVDGRDPKTGKRFGYSGFLPCRDCFGSGQVSEVVLAFLQEADRRSEARKVSGKSTREVAEEMGLDVKTLTYMYLGRAAFPDQTDLPQEVHDYIARRNRPGREINE
jgi:hypothetical protein